MSNDTPPQHAKTLAVRARHGGSDAGSRLIGAVDLFRLLASSDDLLGDLDRALVDVSAPAAV